MSSMVKRDMEARTGSAKGAYTHGRMPGGNRSYLSQRKFEDRGIRDGGKVAGVNKGSFAGGSSVYQLQELINFFKITLHWKTEAMKKNVYHVFEMEEMPKRKYLCPFDKPKKPTIPDNLSEELKAKYEYKYQVELDRYEEKVAADRRVKADQYRQQYQKEINQAFAIITASLSGSALATANNIVSTVKISDKYGFTNNYVKLLVEKLETIYFRMDCDGMEKTYHEYVNSTLTGDPAPWLDKLNLLRQILLKGGKEYGRSYRVFLRELSYKIPEDESHYSKVKSYISEQLELCDLYGIEVEDRLGDDNAALVLDANCGGPTCVTDMDVFDDDSDTPLRTNSSGEDPDTSNDEDETLSVLESGTVSKGKYKKSNAKSKEERLELELQQLKEQLEMVTKRQDIFEKERLASLNDSSSILSGSSEVPSTFRVKVLRALSFTNIKDKLVRAYEKKQAKKKGIQFRFIRIVKERARNNSEVARRQF